MTSARQVRFRLSGGMSLAADIYGAPEAPPVVLLHGGGQTRNAWGRTGEALAERGYRAIALDHRGHGESDRSPEGRYEGADFASDLAEVVAQLDRKPVLVGASLGGIAALLFEGRRETPATAGIVLVDVTPRLSPDGAYRIFEFMRARPDGFASLEEAAEAVASYVPHRKPRKDLSGLAKNLRQGDDGRYRWHWDPRLLDVWDPQRYTPEVAHAAVEGRLEAARQIQVPMMLVRGRMSDVVTEDNARELLEIAPRTEYVDLEGAAHMVAGDVNDAFTAAVTDFVRRVFEP